MDCFKIKLKKSYQRGETETDHRDRKTNTGGDPDRDDPGSDRDSDGPKTTRASTTTKTLNRDKDIERKERR